MMGNIFPKSKKRTKLNAILQTPEAKGVLAEISHHLPFDQALSKLSHVLLYLREIDDFSSSDVQKLLSFLRFYASPNKLITVENRSDWINQLCKEQAIDFYLHTWKLLFTKKLFIPKYENLAKNFRLLADTVWTCMENSLECCDQFCDSNGIQLILESISSDLNQEITDHDQNDANRLYIAHTSISILRCSLGSCPQAKHQFRDARGLEVLRKFLTSEIDILKCEAFICLAHSINEHENHVLFGSGRIVHYALRRLDDGKYCNRLNLIKAFNRLLANDSNKSYLANSGLLDAHTGIIRNRACADEVLETVSGIWILAFDPDCRKKILGNKPLIEALIACTKSGIREITLAAEGAIWIIDKRLQREAHRYFLTQKLSFAGDDYVNNAPTPAPTPSGYEINQENDHSSPVEPGNSNGVNKCNNIVISYEKSSQNLALNLEYVLKKASFHVWMHKNGSYPLDAMIEAMENATMILVFVSDTYKTSPLCRTEAEYIRLLHRDFIPILVEENYQPDGWLAIMIGSKSICDMSNPKTAMDNMPFVIQVLNNGAMPIQNENTLTKMPSMTHKKLQKRQTKGMPRSKTMDPTRSVGQWTRDDVQKWLEKMGLRELKSDFSHFDGSTLIGLQKMFTRAPAIYYCSMKHDFRISDMLTLLKFTNALEMLA